jgi:hypothetical protein
MTGVTGPDVSILSFSSVEPEWQADKINTVKKTNNIGFMVFKWDQY